MRSLTAAALIAALAHSAALAQSAGGALLPAKPIRNVTVKPDGTVAARSPAAAVR